MGLLNRIILFSKDTIDKFSLYEVGYLNVGLFISFWNLTADDVSPIFMRLRTHSIVFPLMGGSHLAPEFLCEVCNFFSRKQ